MLDTAAIPDTTASPEPADSRLAVIDIGSNSIRLVVAQLVDGGGFRILDDERESTRLARSLAGTGRLDDEPIERSIECLRRFRKIALGLRADLIHTIATCAVREATNGEEFCARVRDSAGLDVEVINSRREAQLAFRSVRHAFDISGKNVAIVDVGGGSTEIVFASALHIEKICAAPLGAVRLTECLGTSGRCVGDSYQALVRAVDQSLKSAARGLPFVPHVMFGTGGTFTNLAAMCIAINGENGRPEWGYSVSRAEVRHLVDRLRKMSLKERRGVPGLSRDRADIIVAGLVIVDRVMRHIGVNALAVHTGGVREGLVLSLIDDMSADDEGIVDRDEVIHRFATSCGVDWSHSLHVARLAGQLFRQMAPHFGLDPADEEILHAAALLQDVGYLINYDQHHKHSYHLILNSQLSGFRRRELELIANVARYHRGAKPKPKHENLRQLAPADQSRVRQLAAILRLAGGLDRSHCQNIDALHISIGPSELHIHVTAHADPEVDVWAARSRARLFEKVFDTRVQVGRR